MRLVYEVLITVGFLIMLVVAYVALDRLVPPDGPTCHCERMK